MSCPLALPARLPCAAPAPPAARVRGASFAVAVVALLAAAPPLCAQTWPSRPVRVVVPFAAGGLNDTMARIVAQQLGEQLRTSFLIDNRPGAGGTTGTAIVAQAVPDGYTLLFSSSTTIAVSPSLYKNLAYDPVRDFAPVTSTASVEIVLLVNPQFQARTVKDIVALARAKPGQLKYGSVGIGSSQHLAGELFGAMAKVNLLHVPYKAAGQVLTDTINGLIELNFEPMPTALPHIRAGRLVPVAVTLPKRSRVLPEVPTIAEGGLPGYEMTLWTGILAPRATPRPIIDRLNQVTRKILAGDEMTDRLQALGATATGDTPEEFGAFIRREIARWGEIVRAAGARPE